jgi:hypothetical protein
MIRTRMAVACDAAGSVGGAPSRAGLGRLGYDGRRPHSLRSAPLLRR